jgi:hypothetical protein
MQQDSVELGTALGIMQAGKFHGADVMSSAKEYRQYASECMDWAKSANTEQERDIFLQMAKSWMEAAVLARDRETPPLSSLSTKLPGDQDTAATVWVVTVGTSPADNRHHHGQDGDAAYGYKFLPSHAVPVHFCERFRVRAGIDPLYRQHQSKRSRG